jgi:hypothetical protein
MAGRCVLHIGMHKTGTTSIQAAFFRNTTLQGAHYAALGKSNASVPLQALFLEDASRRPQFVMRGKGPAQIAADRKLYEQRLDAALGHEHPTVLISGEGLATAFSVADLEALRDRLLQQRSSVQVVAYVRDAQGYMESAFQQRLREGRAKSELASCRPRYRERFEKFDQVFGRDNVSLWKFDPATFAQRCVVRDFCQRMGLTIDESTIVRANEGYSAEAASLYYLYRRFADTGELGPGVLRGNQVLSQVLAGWGQRKLRFSPQSLAPLLAKQAADIAWMEARLGESVSAPRQSGADDMAGEQGLLDVDRQTLDWLWGQLGEPTPSRPTPEEVRHAVARLREQLMQQDQVVKA